MIKYLAIILVSIIFFYPIFSSGYMVYVDNPNNYFELNYLSATLVPQHGWINGWSMQGYAGYPILLYRPQLGYFLAIILNRLSFLPLAYCYKIMVVASLAFLMCGMYALLARKFGSIAALCAAFLLMLQKDIYLDKILAGMWNNYIAIGLLLVFFYLLDRQALRMNIKKCIMLGIFFSVIIFAHLYTAVFALLLIFVYMPIWNKKAHNIPFNKMPAIFFIIPITGISLAFFYIYPFIETSWYFSVLTSPKPLSWTIKGFMGGFEGHNFISAFFINFPLIIRDFFGLWGIIYFWKNRNLSYPAKRILIGAAVLIVSGLFLYSDVVFAVPFLKNLRLVTNLQTHRFLVYAHIGLLIFTGYGLSLFLSKFNMTKKIILIALVAILSGSFLAHRYIYVSKGAKTFDELPDSVHLKNLWSWVSNNHNFRNGRIVYQNTVGNSDDAILAESDIYSLAPFYTKVPQIGGFTGATPYPIEKISRTDNQALFGKRLSSLNDREIANRMRLFNGGFIVSCEKTLEGILINSDIFSLEKKFGRFSVFRLREFVPGWALFKEKNTAFRWVVFKDESLKLNIQNNQPDNWIGIKVAFHPYWKAYINGKVAPIRPDEHYMMKIQLPETGNLELELFYSSKKMMPLLVSVSSLLLVLIVLIFPKQKNSFHIRSV
mgnify:CR=1 FL=1